MSHTPGPWELKGAYIGIRRPNRAGAMVFRSIVSIGSPGWPDVKTHEDAKQVVHDNGCLIAAAPELLEAAKSALAYMFAPPSIAMRVDVNKICHALRDAINKAEGMEI